MDARDELSGSLPESEGAEKSEEPRAPEQAPEEVPSVAPEEAPIGDREPTLTELAAVAGVSMERNADGCFTLRGADFPESGLVVEPDKVREVLAGAADGTWREV